MIEEAVHCASLSPSQLGLSSFLFVPLQDTGKADDFLGYAELSFEQLSIGLESWRCVLELSTHRWLRDALDVEGQEVQT